MTAFPLLFDIGDMDRRLPGAGDPKPGSGGEKFPIFSLFSFLSFVFSQIFDIKGVARFPLNKKDLLHSAFSVVLAYVYIYNPVCSKEIHTHTHGALGPCKNPRTVFNPNFKAYAAYPPPFRSLWRPLPH